MSSLSSRRCESCGPDTRPLDADRVSELVKELGGTWTLDGNTLTRELKFKDFKNAFAMATKVALLAEEEAHHPDFEVGWGRLALTLTTHAAKGLTDNDFIMAAKIDEL